MLPRFADREVLIIHLTVFRLVNLDILVFLRNLEVGKLNLMHLLVQYGDLFVSSVITG